MKEQHEFEHSIVPTDRLLSLRLNEIWRYRDLVVLFVRRDFVSKYKQTILGPLWFFIQPIIQTITMTVVFTGMASLSTDGIPPILFYLGGVTAWNYFAQCLKSTSNTFTANASLFGKVYFPRAVAPISVIISNLIQFAIGFSLFLAFYVYYLIYHFVLVYEKCINFHQNNLSTMHTLLFQTQIPIFLDILNL